MKKKYKQLGATLTIIVIIALAMIASYFLSYFDVVGTKTTIANNMLESSVVHVNNIISGDGFRFLVGSFTTNLKYFAPLTLLIVVLISTSIIESSGIIKKMFSRKRKNNLIITTIVVFLSMISVFFGQYSFLLLMPIIALIYKEIGRSPILGLLTVFLATTIGYGAGVFVNYNDYLLGNMTELAATISIDPNYTFSLYSYMYVKIISLFALTGLLSYLIEKRLAPKLPALNEVEEIEFLENETKALKFSLIFLGLYLLAIIYILVPSTFGANLLLDMDQELYVAKLFSPDSPFNEGAFLILLVGFSVTSYIYGFLTKKYTNFKDFSAGFSKHFSGIGEVFVLIFFIAQLIAILSWTNIDTLVAVKLAELMNNLEFSGAPLIILLFIATILIGLFITTAAEKWELMSPLVVPLFMRANYTPEFSQIIFRAADGISKTLTPLFPYYIIMLGFIKKYNYEKPISLFGAMWLILPIIFMMFIFWLLIILSFVIIGAPIGPESFPTL